MFLQNFQLGITMALDKISFSFNQKVWIFFSFPLTQDSLALKIISFLLKADKSEKKGFFNVREGSD